MKKYILFLLFYCTLSSAQVTVLEDSLFSSSLQSTSKYLILLPDAYSETNERFPVIYLLHGYSGDYTNWVKLTGLVQYAQNYKFIIITPDGKNSWYSNAVGIKNAKYEDFIIKDLINHIDQKYRTIQSIYSRSIAGLSMGGYGAIKLSLQYPDKFFFAGGISPALYAPFGLADSALVARRSKGSTQSLKDAFGSIRSNHWDANNVFLLTDKLKSDSAPFFYLSVGSQDGITEIIELTHALTDSFRKHNIPFEMHETAGGHDWKFWDKEIEIVLRRIHLLSQIKKKL